MKRKWLKRSDIIILAMVILWFVAAVWGMVIVTIQVIQGSYSTIIGEVMTFIGAPVASAIITWLIKNMSESNTKNKLNPEYLKNQDPNQPDDFNVA